MANDGSPILPEKVPTLDAAEFERQQQALERNIGMAGGVGATTAANAAAGGVGKEQPVDEHAKLKTKLKTKRPSQPQATSPTCVSRVTWGPTQVSWIPDESHKRSHKESHKDNRSKGSHKIQGIPHARDPTSIQNVIGRDRRSART